MMAEFKTVEVYRVAEKLVREVVCVEPGEDVIILADTGAHPVPVEAMATAIRGAGGTGSIVTIDEVKVPHSALPPAAFAAVKQADAVVLMTQFVIVQNIQIRAAQMDYGTRLVLLCRMTPDRMLSPVIARTDYGELDRTTRKIADAFTAGRRVRITSENGTDYTASIEGKMGSASASKADLPGSLVNIPAGAVHVGPVDGTADGSLVFDAFETLGICQTPIRCRIKESWCTAIEGGVEADQLRAKIEGIENATYAPEIAIGTNALSTSTGLLSLSDEKRILGVIHMGLGDSGAYGGRVRSKSHLDGLIMKPTVEVDGAAIFKAGKLVI